jgi:tRNA (cmo5U34)-methyltransferase
MESGTLHFSDGAVIETLMPVDKAKELPEKEQLGIEEVTLMEHIKQHFEAAALDFDRNVLRIIPHYEDMLQAVIRSIPFGHSAPISVLDVGCGTGRLGQLILETFSEANLICLDFSERMVETAKAKLAGYERVDYVVQDFRDYEFGQSFNVVVSSLALHHLPTDEKRKFYERVHGCLCPGGCFYNADLVLGNGKHLQSLYMNTWETFLEQQLDAEEIQKTLQLFYEEDQPDVLADQLLWLSEIGYTNVDVPWKHYGFAVYGGTKKSWELLRAAPEDAEEILALQRLAFQSEAERYDDFGIPPMTETAELMKELFETHLFLKAVCEGEIIGSVRAYESSGTCHIGRLAVRPDMQNLGIGSALLVKIEKAFTPQRFVLFVGAKSEKSIHLYKKLGYQAFITGTVECGRIKVFHMEKSAPTGVN